jgi:hypothetical protein
MKASCRQREPVSSDATSRGFGEMKGWRWHDNPEEWQ